MTLKVLHSAQVNNGTDFRRTRIFKFDDKKNQKTFKMSYSNRNGTCDMDCYIMDSDGVFQPVLNKYSLGFEHGVSYVSHESDKKKDSDKAFQIAENVIVKIYT